MKETKWGSEGMPEPPRRHGALMRPSSASQGTIPAADGRFFNRRPECVWTSQKPPRAQSRWMTFLSLFFSIFFLCCFLSFKEVSSAQRTLYSFRAQRNVRPRNSVWSIEIIKHLYSSVRMASGTDCQLYTGFCVSCSMDCVFTATDMYFWMAKTKPNGQSCFLFNGQYSFSNREKGDGQ